MYAAPVFATSALAVGCDAEGDSAALSAPGLGAAGDAADWLSDATACGLAGGGAGVVAETAGAAPGAGTAPSTAPGFPAGVAAGGNAAGASVVLRLPPAVLPFTFGSGALVDESGLMNLPLSIGGIWIETSSQRQQYRGGERENDGADEPTARAAPQFIDLRFGGIGASCHQEALSATPACLHEGRGNGQK
jgi:hypothetical protein